jgi:hypothetical protein
MLFALLLDIAVIFTIAVVVPAGLLRMNRI